MNPAMYLVGGAVRDAIHAAVLRIARDSDDDSSRAGKTRARRGEIPDISPAVLLKAAHSGSEADRDFVVCGMPIDELTGKLAELGKCDIVGKSFGVIKFTPSDECEFLGWQFKNGMTYDIALPRKERSTGVHHRDFAVDFDPAIPITDDLLRRDFTINAIAMTPDGVLVDPSGGMNDLNARMLKLVFPLSFAEDPLRILRGAQVAARFGLDLDPDLVESAKNISLDEVSPERIHDELMKALKLAEKPSMFFRHMKHMQQLLNVFPELAGIQIYWERMYEVLDAAPARNRINLLYWFLDRHDEELEWYAAYAKKYDEDAIGRAQVKFAELMWTAEDAIEYARGGTEAWRMFNRLRFSNREIGNAVTLSTYSFRIPESLIRKSRESVTPIIRWTLKNVLDEGVEMRDFLSFSESLFGEVFRKIRREWESEIPVVEDYIENPPITGKRLIEMGFEPGILIGRILETVSLAHDRGEVSTPIDAETFVLEKFGNERTS